MMCEGILTTEGEAQGGTGFSIPKWWTFFQLEIANKGRLKIHYYI